MTRITRTFALVALVGAACLSAPASVVAAPITWEWLGSVYASTIPGIAINSDASLQITFDSAAPDQAPSPSCGIYYPAIISATGNFGGRLYMGSGGAVEVQQGNNFGCGETGLTTPALTFRVLDGTLDGNPVSTPEGAIAYLENGLPLVSDALPLNPNQVLLGAYANRGFRLNVRVGGSNLTALAETQAIRLVASPVNVPEPASLVLLGIGIAAAVRRRHQA